MSLENANNKELVSVVVPVFNAEKRLAKCIESILAQTYYNIEVLLIDDGSTDQSRHICEEYQKKDSRLRFFHQENRGVSEARNLGIDMANGSKLCFVDSDDSIETHFIEQMYMALVIGLCEYVICNFAVDRGNVPKCLWGIKKNQKFTIQEYEDKYLFNLPPNTFIGGCVSKMYDMKIIKDYGIRFVADIKYAEDYVFNLDYLQFVSNLVVIAQPLYVCSLDNEDSLSRKKPSFIQMLSNWERIYIEFYTRYQSRMTEVLTDRIKRGYIITYLECFDMSKRVSCSQLKMEILDSFKNRKRKNIILKSKMVRKYPHFLVHLLMKMRAYSIIGLLLKIRK